MPLGQLQNSPLPSFHPHLDHLDGLLKRAWRINTCCTRTLVTHSNIHRPSSSRGHHQHIKSYSAIRTVRDWTRLGSRSPWSPSGAARNQNSSRADIGHPELVGRCPLLHGFSCGSHIACASERVRSSPKESAKDTAAVNPFRDRSPATKIEAYSFGKYVTYFNNIVRDSPRGMQAGVSGFCERGPNVPRATALASFNGDRPTFTV
jgi:hypothetical protein